MGRQNRNFLEISFNHNNMPGTWEVPNAENRPKLIRPENEINKPGNFSHAKRFLEKIIEGMEFSKELHEKNKDREGIMSIEKKQNDIARIKTELDRGKISLALAILEKYSVNIGAEDLSNWRKAIFEISIFDNSENEPINTDEIADSLNEIHDRKTNEAETERNQNNKLYDREERKKVSKMLETARKWKNVMAEMSANDEKETEPNLIEKEIWELHNMISGNPKLEKELTEQIIELRQIRDAFYAMKFKESSLVGHKEKQYSMNN